MSVMIVSTGSWNGRNGRNGRNGWVGRVPAFLTTLPMSTLLTDAGELGFRRGIGCFRSECGCECECLL